MKTYFSEKSVGQRKHIKAPSRLIKILTLVLTAAIGQPNIASAQKAPPPDIVVEAKDSCEKFALGIYLDGNPKATKDFVDKNGTRIRTITAGKGYFLTFMNMKTEALLQIRASGSVQRSIVNQDGSITYSNTGHNVLIQFASDIPGPSAIQYIGRMIYTVGIDGIFTIEGTSGRQVDICAALSS